MVVANSKPFSAVLAMVGGFEPPTSWLTVNRSTTELHHLRLTPSASVDSRTCGAVSPIHRCRSQQSYRFLPLVLYVFTKRLQAKIFKYSPRVEESFHSDLIRCMESFNRCGHGAVTTMAITRRIMKPWPQNGLMYLALHVCRFCLCDAKTSGLNVACWLT